jgi:hypothetical protein
MVLLRSCLGRPSDAALSPAKAGRSTYGRLTAPDHSTVLRAVMRLTYPEHGNRWQPCLCSSGPAARSSERDVALVLRNVAGPPGHEQSQRYNTAQKRS